MAEDTRGCVAKLRMGWIKQLAASNLILCRWPQAILGLSPRTLPEKENLLEGILSRIPICMCSKWHPASISVLHQSSNSLYRCPSWHDKGNLWFATTNYQDSHQQRQLCQQCMFQYHLGFRIKTEWKTIFLNREEILRQAVSVSDIKGTQLRCTFYIFKRSKNKTPEAEALLLHLLSNQVVKKKLYRCKYLRLFHLDNVPEAMSWVFISTPTETPERL